MKRVLNRLGVFSLLIGLSLMFVFVGAIMSGCRGNGSGGNDVPKLDATIEAQIKATFVTNEIVTSVDEVTITSYFGTFDGASVFTVTLDIPFGGAMEIEVEIAGFTFLQSTQWLHGIIAWYDGELFSLSQAYDDNMLTKADISVIHQIYQGGN